MSDDRDQLNILAPVETKSKLDALHRTVERAAGHPMSRRSALGLGGLMLLAACGSTSTGTGGQPAAPRRRPTALAGKPLENHLEIFNWSEYDDPSTYKKFMALPAEAEGRAEDPRDLLLVERRAAGQAATPAARRTTSSRRARTPSPS